jgi:NAD(P)-dependent dehydrogenase (short-subunit alcohol dehydrogenase family)
MASPAEKGYAGSMDFSLHGKIALITGSTTGIGRMLARGFTQAGVEVWGHGPNQASLNGLDGELNGRVVTADFTDQAQINTMGGMLNEILPRLDILINNAGVEIIMPLDRWDMQVFRKTMQVNLEAPVMLTGLLLPLLKRSEAEGGAAIINITSVHETVPYPNNSAYSMSKAALNMFTKAMSLELAPHGIRINNLAPGAVETDLNREVLDRIGREKFAEWIPLGRVSNGGDVLPPALFLASPGARYITGTTLYAEGGYMHNLVRYRP